MSDAVACFDDLILPVSQVHAKHLYQIVAAQQADHSPQEIVTSVPVQKICCGMYCHMLHVMKKMAKSQIQAEADNQCCAMKKR